MTRTSPPSDSHDAVFETSLSLPNRRQGKVRDVYDVPATTEHPAGLLIVASDRISAFDVVMPTPVPGKGRLLTEISTRWFRHIRPYDVIGDHLISTDADDLPELSDQDRRQVDGRMMFGRACRVIPIECVVRGYLAGSGWNEYEATGTVCGVRLPAGLEQCGRLPEPIFTPATKAAVGHDENIDFERACDIAGRGTMTVLRDVSLRLYALAAKHAEANGIILADTKLEFGHVCDDEGQPTDEILLIDEIFTPDSSRFWPAAEYEPGRDQHSFDKQYVRNFLLDLVKDGRWNREAPGPVLPPDIVRNTLGRYREARDLLFGT